MMTIESLFCSRVAKAKERLSKAIKLANRDEAYKVLLHETAELKYYRNELFELTPDVEFLKLSINLINEFVEGANYQMKKAGLAYEAPAEQASEPKQDEPKAGAGSAGAGAGSEQGKASEQGKTKGFGALFKANFERSSIITAIFLTAPIIRLSDGNYFYMAYSFIISIVQVDLILTSFQYTRYNYKKIGKALKSLITGKAIVNFYKSTKALVEANK